MRIGFDIDGVLADFNAGFIERVKAVTGRDLFPAGYVPHTWQYPTAVGYTPEEERKVWDVITADRSFWLGLPPYEGAMDVIARLRMMSLEHDVYFATSRPGLMAKQQTEVWLATHSGDFMWNPTVMISSNKGDIARALKLDYYIDDRDANVLDVVMSTWSLKTGEPTTKVFLLDAPWNREMPVTEPYDRITRVTSPAAMLDCVEALRKARVAA